ncbi:thioester reductase domain-containing protein [Paludibacterium paludis]|uniref:Thioester reductase (TE) domain-containing protein n=1 Tax=Paludibacterium paludis TaxID=1225769 RepID=A0A918U9T9_9NEIS|nr:thioester reductase domain-containing protein [Paludibacterium paludis]GGY14827.1 hypothetical protein GCM10011289_17700 [Paludibacterium paludis]
MDYRNRTLVGNIVLTGATGVLGGRLLQEVLETTDAMVYCVVRAESPDAALERIKEVLFAYDEARTLDSQCWRIIPVLGDVSRERLGLDEASYLELAGSVDLVLHSAANVSLVASYAKIAPVNVGGVATMIEFCLAGSVPLMMVSSFSVTGSKLYEPGFVLGEHDLDVGQCFEEMDYERSKFEAEQLVHAASERGLDWVIVRPGNIWGDSRTGCYPLRQTRVKGLYYEMLKSLVETGLTFSSDEDFDISPVDYVARAALYAVMNLHVTNRRTFNLTHPHPINYDDIVAALRHYGYTIGLVDSTTYFEALQSGRLCRDGKPYRSTFTDLLSIFYDGSDIKEHARYDTSGIDALLADTDIRCHPCDAALIGRYLDYAVRTGFIVAPAQQGPLATLSESAVRGGGLMEQLYDADLSDMPAQPA